jgi:hypothetical protein
LSQIVGAGEFEESQDPRAGVGTLERRGLRNVVAAVSLMLAMQRAIEDKALIGRQRPI